MTSGGSQEHPHSLPSRSHRFRLPSFLRHLFRMAGRVGGSSIPDRLHLEQKLGYTFHDLSLLQQALTHRSHVHVTGMERLQSNERLEFLGDSVLGMVVNEFLYLRFSEKEEGELTKIKSLLVCGSTLAKVGEQMGLGEHLLLSRSEAGTGGRKRESILADATEAVIGAVYLDGGLEATKELIKHHILVNVNDSLEERTHHNYKSQLQEKLQARYKVPPRYKVSYTTGPDHARRFTVKVTLRGKVLGVGSGTSKKQAEQRAAESALARLDEIGRDGTLPTL